MIGELRTTETSQQRHAAWTSRARMASATRKSPTRIRASTPGCPVRAPPSSYPSARLLPHAPREGIVINLPEHRLYWFPPAGAGEPPVVWTFPVSIGKMDWNTPLGETRIVSKIKDPTWTPPHRSVKSMRRAATYCRRSCRPGPTIRWGDSRCGSAFRAAPT